MTDFDIVFYLEANVKLITNCYYQICRINEQTKRNLLVHEKTVCVILRVAPILIDKFMI